MSSLNAFFAGVGGQGIITGASIIARAAITADVNAVMSEVHGMAQRGGSVVSELRLGDVHSPMIPEGEADLVMGFEPVETVRSLTIANHHTVVVTDVRPIIPVSVSLGGTAYPDVEDLLSYLRSQVAAVQAVPAAAMAEEIGLPQAANIVLLGAAMETGLIPLELGTIRDTLSRTVPAKALEANLRALQEGFELTRKP
ncbi:MAG: indolepyruvate oxidoreductase subunit beta [Candidatus Cryosericum sp.]